MYCDYFGFSEKPFTVTPNPNYVYLSGIHREAFSRLVYGIDSHAGFVVLTGEVGTGKTTLLRTLLTRLDADRYRSALIFSQCLSREQLLANVCREFGLVVPDRTFDACAEALNTYLLEQHAAGRTVVLVIDEAQNLAPEVLEQVRLLSNLETTRDKLIQIVLAGQPELDTILARHDLRQLQQRIEVRCRLSAMSLDDTCEYVAHRLRIAGNRIPDLFSRAAVRKMYRYARGVPRLINIVCEQALVLAWTREQLAVTPKLVAAVVAELSPPPVVNGLWGRITGWLFAGR